MDGINAYLRQIDSNIAKLKGEQRVLMQYSAHITSLESRVTELSRQNDLMKRMLTPKQLDQVLAGQK